MSHTVQKNGTKENNALENESVRHHQLHSSQKETNSGQQKKKKKQHIFLDLLFVSLDDRHDHR